MRMKPATINACLVMAEPVDPDRAVLLNVVQQWLLANEMNFRHLVYRPGLIPIEADKLPSYPANTQIADALRFAFGRLEGDSLRSPVPEGARLTREALLQPPSIAERHPRSDDRG
jgi:hypothetical protein